MTVLSMRPKRGREADYGKITEHTATEEWLAHSDTRFESDYALCQYGWNNGILPVPYVSIIDGINPLIPLLCRKLKIMREEKSPQHFVIRADYSSEPITIQERQQQSNPLDLRPKIKWKTSKYNKPIFQEVDDDENFILNSAGDFFDPSPEVDRSRWVCNVTTNVEFVPDFLIDYADTVNIDGFTIQGVVVPPLVARLSEIDISEQQIVTVGEDEIAYYTFGYSMEMNPDTWMLELLDQGVRQKDPNSPGDRVAVKDNAVPPKSVNKPWPLDGDGTKLDDPNPTNCVKLEFFVYHARDFSVLPGINT